MFFKHLRETEFNPTFEWVETSIEAAEKINLPHEDYPKYVRATEDVLLGSFWKLRKIPALLLLRIHKEIFTDKPFAGKFRDVDVRVGEHRPSTWRLVGEQMLMLEKLYEIKNTKELIEWYKDFETIHPFQDGNGRVGGVIVATYAHNLHPAKGWLAPNQ
jgi:hypothetical protein